MPIARFNGSATYPVVEFALNDGETGIGDWLRDLPEAEFDEARGTWLVTGFETEDPDGLMRERGTVIQGPDGLPCSLNGYAAPYVCVDTTFDVLSIHPRLAGKEHGQSGLSTDAKWMAGEHRWLTPRTAQFSGQYLTTAVIHAGITLNPPAVPDLKAVADPLVYDGSLDGLRAVPVSDLKSVNRPTGEALSKVGIESVYDLLHCVPRRYIDLSQPMLIAQAKENDDKVPVIGIVEKVGTRAAKTGTKITTVKVRDAAGDQLDAQWFNAPWMARRFAVGARVVFFGKVEPGFRKGQLQMNGPLGEVVEEGKTGLIPIYPASGKADLSTWQVMRAAKEAVSRMGELLDPVPADMLKEHGFMTRSQAFLAAHAPATAEQAAAGHDRLAYDELLHLQLALAIERSKATAPAGFSHPQGLDGLLARGFIDALPYPLTGAQQRALGDIAGDMAQAKPMHRLLQGEVGSGKTVVSTIALLLAVQQGWQGALMAPTETLSFQHFLEIEAAAGNLTHPSGIPLRVAYLANTVTGKAKKDVLAGLAGGTIDIVVGTHALVAENVQFRALSCVVIDEQHRFGADQRAALAAKAPAGKAVDLLVATATPVPRTAMMTAFGDLDVSIIDEMPPGRTLIQTYGADSDIVELDDPLALPWQLIRSQVAAGRQAFIVVPLVEKSATREAAAAHDTAERLTGPGGALEGLRVQVVTGKDKPAERRQVMDDFRAGSADVLVATTVIEVGVNVPNATVIVVLGADSFGISQLHQLRGRVGRGKHAGHCVLVGDISKGSAAYRIDALVQSTNGFELSEMDLRLRGWGTLLGQMQSGAAKDLKVADLFADEALIPLAQADARSLIDGDPGLNRRPGLRDEIARSLGADAGAWLTTA